MTSTPRRAVPAPPRLRQTVLAAHDLDAVVAQLRAELELGEPYRDPAVAYFGLRNAVFALGRTFLEVVSPVRDDAAAARWLGRRKGDGGYMLMFQVEDLPGARERARGHGVREVFEVDLPDIAEVHLHPGDMRGVIVALSAPRPPESWRWGGDDWRARAAPFRLAGARVALPDSRRVAARWGEILGRLPECLEFEENESDRGVIEIRLAVPAPREPTEIAGVRFSFYQEAP